MPEVGSISQNSSDAAPIFAARWIDIDYTMLKHFTRREAAMATFSAAIARHSHADAAGPPPPSPDGRSRLTGRRRRWRIDEAELALIDTAFAPGDLLMA